MTDLRMIKYIRKFFHFMFLLFLSNSIAKGQSTTKIVSSCLKGIDGLPVGDLSGIKCQLDRKIHSLGKLSLPELTENLIGYVQIKADFNWSSGPHDLRQFPAENITLQIPSQNILMKAFFVEGDSLNFSFSISPLLKVSGKSICHIKLEKFALNISHLQSELEPWLNQTLQNSLNEDPDINQSLTKLISSELKNLRNENCRVDPPTISLGQPRIANLKADIERLREKYHSYLELSRDQLDQQAWVYDTHCDGLLFNSLYASAGGESLIGLAEDSFQPGRYYRHWQKDCYLNHLKGIGPNSSKSTISRDMMMGLSYWMWDQRQGDRVADVIAFGNQHSLQGLPLVWMIGEGQTGRVELTPSLIQTLYEMNEKLNGEAIPKLVKEWNLQVWPRCDGYECHLMALHMLLRWRIHGTLEPLAKQRLRWLIEKEPHNALFSAIYGLVTNTGMGWNQALNTLLNPKWFPDDRLPNSNDRCSYYLFQRDYLKDGQVSPSWLPCPEKDEAYTGIDFIFASALILEGAESILKPK